MNVKGSLLQSVAGHFAAYAQSSSKDGKDAKAESSQGKKRKRKTKVSSQQRAAWDTRESRGVVKARV